jgi:phage repressor protein C with HTH and peptisase S24 domain
VDQAVRPELFDEAGFPVGPGWDEIDFPNLEDPNAYALEVRGDHFLPTYRDGDLVVVSPTAGVRRRDRIMLQTKAGAVMAGALLRRTAQRIEIQPLTPDAEPQVLPVRDVAWLARIVWVSQ